ncbi:hypothetical protein CaCOL14_000283 [Colletotrichum acutatum]
MVQNGNSRRSPPISHRPHGSLPPRHLPALSAYPYSKLRIARISPDHYTPGATLSCTKKEGSDEQEEQAQVPFFAFSLLRLYSILPHCVLLCAVLCEQWKLEKRHREVLVPRGRANDSAGPFLQKEAPSAHHGIDALRPCGLLACIPFPIPIPLSPQDPRPKTQEPRPKTKTRRPASARLEP